jgi:S-adenosylmethionine:tRNA ribosyltransferase-isomerase
LATEPPEARGLARDEVRLLVASPGRITHARFRDLPAYLRPGDLLVVNTSATRAAALDGVRADGRPVVVHVATTHDRAGEPIVELRLPDASGPALDGEPGERVTLAGGAVLTLLAPQPGAPRLWRAAAPGIAATLVKHGRPIVYGYLRGRWPLAAYQPVFGREPGSAEMPSAGRPFTDRMVTELITAGVTIAPVLLHTGVSSLESGEAPQPEWYRVPGPTARLVEHARRYGGRVIAVGTTVTRALESATSVRRGDSRPRRSVRRRNSRPTESPGGRVSAGAGWTDLVLGPQRTARVVTGLVTGWHEPGASHLSLLEAVAGAELVDAAYREALDAGYLWHEFGDSCLLLP